MPGPYEGRCRSRIARTAHLYGMGQTTHVSEEMVLVRVRGRRGAVGDTELCVDVFDVARDGMRADREHLGDLAVGAARDQVHQHSSFARTTLCVVPPAGVAPTRATASAHAPRRE